MGGMDVDNAFAEMDLLQEISDAKSPLCVFTIRGCNHHFEGKLGFQSDDSNLTLEQCTIRYICDVNTSRAPLPSWHRTDHRANLGTRRDHTFWCILHAWPAWSPRS